jgi:hypothetical protein
VPVRYIPNEPDWNYLVSGEPTDHPTWLLIVLGCVFTGMFGSIVLMNALGFADLSIKNGKMRLIQFGQLEEDFDQPQPSLPRQHATALPIDLAPPSTIAYAAPRAALPGTRPAGITAIAVCAMVFGILGLIFNGCRAGFLIGFAGRTIHVGGSVFVIDPRPGLVTWYALDAVLAAMLIVASVGLLKMRRWGRRLAILAAAGQILSTLVSVGVSIHGIAALPRAMKPPELVGAAGGIVILLLTAVFPLIVLIVLGRPSVARSFKNCGT